MAGVGQHLRLNVAAGNSGGSVMSGVGQHLLWMLLLDTGRVGVGCG